MVACQVLGPVPSCEPRPGPPRSKTAAGVSTRQNHQSLNVTNKFHPAVAPPANHTSGASPNPLPHSRCSTPTQLSATPTIIVIGDNTSFSSRKGKARVQGSTHDPPPPAQHTHTRAHTHTHTRAPLLTRHTKGASGRAPGTRLGRKRGGGEGTAGRGRPKEGLGAEPAGEEGRKRGGGESTARASSSPAPRLKEILASARYGVSLLERTLLMGRRSISSSEDAAINVGGRSRVARRAEREKETEREGGRRKKGRRGKEEAHPQGKGEGGGGGKERGKERRGREKEREQRSEKGEGENCCSRNTLFCI